MLKLGDFKVKTKSVPINNTKNVPLFSLFVVFITGIIVLDIVWMNSYLNRGVKYIGAFSQYLTKDELIDGINNALRNNNEEIYSAGFEALSLTGYSNSHALLMLEEVGLAAFLIPFAFIILGILCIIMYRKRKGFYITQVNNLKDWANGKQLESTAYSGLPDELIELVTDLKKQLERLSDIHEEDNKRLISYLEDISHQLKTPLSVIRALCEKNLESAIESSNDMTRCLSAVDKMHDLIRELLILGRLECEKINVKFSKISPHDMMETLSNDYEFLLHQAGITLFINGDSFDKWLCDEFWIRQAIDNIISNAIKHSDSGGKIVLSYHSSSTENCITIWDEGIGFENGAEETIFNRFSSKDRSGREGFGLGLAISKKIIELHFGTITACNHVPKGAEFHIRFPRLDADTIFNNRPANVTLL